MKNYMITGVMKDTPANSHFNINLLLSHSTLAVTMYDGWTEDQLGSFHGHLLHGSIYDRFYVRFVDR